MPLAMNKLFHVLFFAAVFVAVVGLSACYTTKPRGCGCGMEEHLR